MPNRLAQETSPYLLQHSENPVDWHPWGDEALGRAREEDRPILLSVGYSACHWCHVMERESFEDAATAAYMNEHFVNVKVDREERPDVDALYMEAVQTISGQGGWPMTVFLDPEGVPFYGGTYFPPDEGRGMPSFRMVMEAVVEAFENRRGEIAERAPQMRAQLGAIGAIEPAEPPEAALLEQALEGLRAAADRERGGFGGAPKFPPASALELLLARGEREIVERTLDAMLAGGIYDQLGGGFSRYSVDAGWLVPHFEKMLYDNAQLARAYLHGWQALGHQRYRRVCEETLDWMLAEMRGPEGGFHSALDADSEGEEGLFYTWTPEEIEAAIAADPNCIKFQLSQSWNLMQFYGVAEGGNFEGRSVLHLAGGAAGRSRRDWRRCGRRCSRRGRSGCGRGSTTSGSRRGTRWRSAPWPRPARCSSGPTTSTRRASARPSSGSGCATSGDGCCAPSRTGAPASPPTSRTTPSCSRRCSPSTKRASSRSGSSAPASWPRPRSSATPTPSAAASSPPRPTRKR